jgi:hypothetical protein
MSSGLRGDEADDAALVCELDACDLLPLECCLGRLNGEEMEKRRSLSR